MDTVYLIACVSKKRSTAMPASELYCSPWFKAAKRYVGDRPWYILSAAHNLVPPSCVLSPYNITLNTMPVESRRAWGKQVASFLPQDKHYVFLAGKNYWENIVPHIESYETPLKGLGIGQQLAWFKCNS